MWKKITLLLLALSLILGTTAFAAGNKKEEAPKTSAEELYNAGVDLLDKEDYSGAQAKFKAALEENDDFAEAHNNLAYSLRKSGKEHHDAALEHYNRAIALKPDLAQAYHYRGVLHVLAKNEAGAKADHAKLLELDRELADELMKVIASREEPEGHGGAAARWQ